MTEKIYYIDTKQTQFTSTVTACEFDEKKKVYKVCLKASAFFPEEGGQLADIGILDEQTVLDVHIKNDILYHYVEKEIPVGKEVFGQIDWSRRFDFMQQHSGEHILSGLLHSTYGFTNVGFHLGLTEVTLDVDGAIGIDALREIERKANEVIWKNIPILCSFPDRETLANMSYRSKIEIEGQVRIVEIPGVDLCACCAPHVDSTGQIGMIKILDAMPHRGGTRITIACGGRALLDYTTKQTIVKQSMGLLSAKESAVIDATAKLFDDINKWKTLANTLTAELLTEKCHMLATPDESQNAYLFVSLNNTVAIRNTINELTDAYAGYCGIFAGNDETGYTYIMGSKTLDCRTIGSHLRDTLNAKGGGSNAMIQGNITATRQAIETQLSTFTI